MAASGGLGEIRAFDYLYTPCPPTLSTVPGMGDPELAGGGQLFDIGSHMMDAITFMLGAPQRMETMTANRSGGNAPDTHSAILKLQNGVQGSINLCFSADGRRDALTILGSKGSLTMSLMNYTDVVVKRGDTAESYPSPCRSMCSSPDPAGYHTLRGLDTLDTTARDALQTQELLEAMHLGRSWQAQKGN